MKKLFYVVPVIMLLAAGCNSSQQASNQAPITQNTNPAQDPISKNDANYINDTRIVNETKTTIKWVEDFYTTQGRYPTKAEFTNQFPNLKGYDDYSEASDVPYFVPYNFNLHYNISEPRPFAIGGGVGGSKESWGYEVGPCLRWGKVGTDGNPKAFSYEYIRGTPIDGLIAADFKAETIFFIYNGNSVPPSLRDKRILLLTGIKNPRLFQSGNFDEIYITNGDGIYHYKISLNLTTQIIQLTDPQKVGTVPLGCPSD